MSYNMKIDTLSSIDMVSIFIISCLDSLYFWRKKMALSDPIYSAVVSFTETSGLSVDREYFGGPDFTTYDEFVTGFAIALPKIVAMSDSVVSKIVYKTTFLEEALTLPSAAENNNQAIMSGKIIGHPNKSGVVTVPAVKPSLMVSPTGKGYDVLDMGDAAVLAFVKMFDSGEATGDWLISDGESWDYTTVFGKRRNTKSTSS